MGDLFVSGSLATAAAVRCSSWPMGYAHSQNGCSLSFQNQSNLLVCSTPMHMGRLHMEEYDQAWTAILHRHSVTNETNAKAKRKRIALEKEKAAVKLPPNDSIIEEIQNMKISQGVPIVPLKLRKNLGRLNNEQKFDFSRMCSIKRTTTVTLTSTK